jgi:CBS-domain-containing membrane protein
MDQKDENCIRIPRFPSTTDCMNTPPAGDVTCRSIMSETSLVLLSTVPLRVAVETLLTHRLLAMPVVDEQRRYLGQFRKNLVVATVLPQVALHDDRFSQVARMIDAGLLQDTLQDVQERFAAIAHQPVSSHLDRNAPVLRPDQPLITALFYLFRGRNFLPVVEPSTQRLLGTISAWDVLERMIATP